MGLTVTPLFLSLSSFQVLQSVLMRSQVRHKKTWFFCNLNQEKASSFRAELYWICPLSFPWLCSLGRNSPGMGDLVVPIRWWAYRSSTTLVPHTTSSTDPVNILLHLSGHIIIDHMFDILDIQSPGCDCSGHCPGKSSWLQDYIRLHVKGWLVLLNFQVDSSHISLSGK